MAETLASEACRSANEMITLRIATLFKKYDGNPDSLQHNARDLRNITKQDSSAWSTMTELVQALGMINSNLSSPEFVDDINKRLILETEDQAVRDILIEMARRPK